MTLNVELITTLKRETFGHIIYNTISKCGTKIFMVYCIHIDGRSKMICELLENKEGKLCTISSIRAENDGIYKYVHSGFASDNFDKFSVIDSDGRSRVRIRIFDNNLREINSKIFSDYYGSSGEVLGGNMTNDGKYIILTYVTDNNAGKSFQKTMVKVLDTCCLNEKKSYTLCGNISTQPRFFRLNGDNNEYIILTSHNIKNSTIFKNIEPPKLNILKMNDSFLDLVCEIELVEKSNYDFVKTPKNSLRIVVGTLACFNNDGPNYIDNLDKSYICNDDREYRIYKFKKHKLKLVSGKKYGFDIYPKFYPTEHKISIGQSIDTFMSFQIFDVDEKCVPIDDTGNKNIIFPPNSYYNFSSDGRWLLVTGSISGDRNVCKKYEKNILLFRLE